eukprot:1063519-Pelagomonas_calceolata.AAC.1
MHMPFIHLIQCLNSCTWIFPIISFAALPDSGCGNTLSELNRLFGPIVLPQSVMYGILMQYKMENMCSSDVPIPRLAVKRLG